MTVKTGPYVMMYSGMLMWGAAVLRDSTCFTHCVSLIEAIPVGVAVYKACLMKGILKVGRNRCPVPVIGCLNLYVVPHGAGCSGFPQCLLDVTLRDRYRQVVGGPFLAFDAAA